MTALVALLRGVNIGGRWIKMADLTALFAEIGFAGARTYVQSGNIVFDPGGMTQAAAKAKIEKGIVDRFGFHAETMLRTEDQLRALITANPFAEIAANDPAHLVVHFSTAPFGPGDRAALDLVWQGPEEWRLVHDDLFITYPAGIGRSKLKLKLKTLTTARNWKSVLALAEIASAINSQPAVAAVKSLRMESGPHRDTGAAMAKGQQKPSKEKRKPKADKNKPKAAATPMPMAAPAPAAAGKKK